MNFSNVEERYADQAEREALHADIVYIFYLLSFSLSGFFFIFYFYRCAFMPMGYFLSPQKLIPRPTIQTLCYTEEREVEDFVVDST